MNQQSLKKVLLCLLQNVKVIVISEKINCLHWKSYRNPVRYYNPSWAIYDFSRWTDI